MKTLYLHVGLQKTGTSSVQQYLLGEDSPLPAAGIDILPALIAPRVAHHSIAWEVAAHQRRDPALPGLDDLLSALSASEAPAAFVSSEDFSIASAAQIDALRRRLKAFDVRPILGLRSQLTWAESLFAQACKRGHPGDFETYAETLRAAGKLDFLGIATAWAEAFGREGTTLIVHETNPDMVAAVAEVMGVPAPSQTLRRNRSMNERFVWTSQRIITRLEDGGLEHGGRRLPPETRDAAMRALLRVGSKRPEFVDSPVFLDRLAAQDLLSTFAEDNRRLGRMVDLPEDYFELPEERREPMMSFAVDMEHLVAGLFEDPAMEEFLETV